MKSYKEKANKREGVDVRRDPRWRTREEKGQTAERSEEPPVEQLK